jgi:prepilin-type N-terminal cleavage/methylation domain-containing protein
VSEPAQDLKPEQRLRVNRELSLNWDPKPAQESKYPSVSRNSFHGDLKTSDRLTGKERVKEPVSARASEYLSTSSASVGRNGFTLVEIIVALCIVAILTAIAVPGFRKATEDFRLNEFACNFESLIKAFRSYYLIFNEWPADSVQANGNIRYFLPNHLHNGNRFVYTPFRKSSAYFDFENWSTRRDRVMPTIGLTARDLGSHFQLGWPKLQSLGDYKNHFYNINDLHLNKNDDIFYRFPDIPPTNNENRYY